MKKCNKCGEQKDLSEFRSRSISKDKKQSWCKKCADESKKIWYIKNKIKYRKLALIWIKKRKIEVRKFLLEYLKHNPCIDCKKIFPPECMDFDHIKDKKCNISTMMSNSIEQIKKEIEKCEVRCANCHRIKTARQLNWYKDHLVK